MADRASTMGGAAAFFRPSLRWIQGRAGIIEGLVPIFFLFSLLRIDDTD